MAYYDKITYGKLWMRETVDRNRDIGITLVKAGRTKKCPYKDKDVFNWRNKSKRSKMDI